MITLGHESYQRKLARQAVEQHLSTCELCKHAMREHAQALYNLCGAGQWLVAHAKVKEHEVKRLQGERRLWPE